MGFPSTRLRRLRATPSLRRLVRGASLEPSDLILPLFVHDRDPGTTEAIDAMPGVVRWGLDRLAEPVGAAQEAGLGAVLLFGLPEDKSAQGENALDPHGIFARAVRAAKDAAPALPVITDVCFCAFTEHGHCGVWNDDRLDNDATLDILGKQAVVHARAGADIVAPSDMTDGKIGAIRRALDDAGFVDLPILSYAAKFASAYYGPFRVAADNKPGKGDRKSYQMDVGNAGEAVRECRLDVEEGADMVMVKPALAFLDVVRMVKDALGPDGVPVACYNVSGEYSMIEAAARAGWIDRDKVMMETLTSMRRAGADIVLTYHALDAAKLLRSGWEVG